MASAYTHMHLYIRVDGSTPYGRLANYQGYMDCRTSFFYMMVFLLQPAVLPCASEKEVRVKNAEKLMLQSD